MVTYDMNQLLSWKEAAVSAGTGNLGLYFVDIDETRNRVELGVKDAQEGESFVAMLQGTGVPSDAIAFELGSPPGFRTTLNDRFRPVRGGFQHRWDIDTVYTGTISFTTMRGVDLGFVTASHSTHDPFELDGAWQYQALYGSGNKIGYEAYDFEDNPQCILNSQGCRFSDAAFHTADDTVGIDWGYVARTTDYAWGEPGSVTIDENYPRWRIAGSVGKSIQTEGDTINKVGRSSGWTKGIIIDTCEDFPNHYTGLKCQWVALLWSEGGDSGSPVGATYSYGGSSLWGMWGVLWGGPRDEYGQPIPDTTYYSPIEYVESELGIARADYVCGFYGPCYPPVKAYIYGTHTIRVSGYYEWEAVVGGGTGTYTYQWQKKDEGESVWEDLGTASTQQLYVSTSDPSFYLRVVVTSGDDSTSPDLFVAVIGF